MVFISQQGEALCNSTCSADAWLQLDLLFGPLDPEHRQVFKSKRRQLIKDSEDSRQLVI